MTGVTGRAHDPGYLRLRWCATHTGDVQVQHTHLLERGNESFDDGTRDRGTGNDSGGAVDRSTEIRAAGSSSRGARRPRDARTSVVRPAEDALWPLGSTLGKRQDDRRYLPAV